MIYRIKIMQDGKFVRYATAEEMESLKPKADGTGVVKYTIEWDYVPTDCIRDDPPDRHYIKATDVSSTHEVEWGVVINGVSIYENDIVSTSIDRGDHEPFNDYLLVCLNGGEFFMRSLLANDGYLNFFIESTDKIIGNSNENPELLEEANE